MKIKRSIIFFFLLAAAISGFLTHLSCSRKVKRAPADVVFITIDTVRADHLGIYGYKFIKTPNMDRMGREGALFEQVRVPTAITLPSHTTIFTGLYPPAHGVRDNGGYKVPKGLPTLAQIIHDAGYNTGAVIGSFVLDRRFGLDQGFDHYDDTGLAKANPKDIFFFAERNAGQVTDRALEWLSSVAGAGGSKNKIGGSKRFFLWAHYFDAHFRYSPPPPFDKEYAESPYDGEIAYVDEQIGRLLEGVYKLRGRKNLLVVIVADHGESLGDHGELTHGVFIYDSTVHVPLIFYEPGVIRPIRIPYRISSVDITPTVLDLLGISGKKGAANPTAQMQGTSLVPMLEGGGRDRVAYLESAYGRLHYGWSELRGLAADGYTFIESPKSELYSFSDTQQDNDLGDSKQDLVQSFTKRVEALVRELSRPVLASQSAKSVSAEEKRNLAAVGYISLNESNEATQEIQPIAGINPADKKFFQLEIGKAMGASSKGKYDEAIKAIQKLIADNPENASLYGLQGIIYEQAGDPTNARESYLTALEIDPKYEFAMVRLANIELKLKNVDKARGYLNTVLEINPNDVEVYQMLGDLEYDQGNVAKARQILEKAVAIAPDDSTARLALGKFYIKTSDYLKAGEQFEKGLAIAPDDTQILIQTGKMRLLNSDRKGAIEALTKATEISPDSAEAQFELAYALETGSDDTLQGPGADLGGAQMHYRRAFEIDKNYLRVKKRMEMVEKAIVRTGGVP